MVVVHVVLEQDLFNPYEAKVVPNVQAMRSMIISPCRGQITLFAGNGFGLWRLEP